MDAFVQGFLQVAHTIEYQWIDGVPTTIEMTLAAPAARFYPLTNV
jgi:hypothetical protein